jgi:hypothetical protein
MCNIIEIIVTGPAEETTSFQERRPAKTPRMLRHKLSQIQKFLFPLNSTLAESAKLTTTAPPAEPPVSNAVLPTDMALSQVIPAEVLQALRSSSSGANTQKSRLWENETLKESWEYVNAAAGVCRPSK